MTASPRSAQVSAVIFDMDGLLLDTEPIYTAATQDVVGRFGKTFDWSIKSRMIGRPATESARILVEALDLPISPEEYLQRREALMLKRFATAPAKPGARALVEYLARHGVPRALATSSTRAHFDVKASRHQDWFSLFEPVITGDDPQVARGKPAPDIFLAAARHLGAAPERCLVFEDAPSGLEAARTAGMSVVVVPDPAMDRAAFEQADQILESLEQFDPSRWGLPPR